MTIKKLFIALTLTLTASTIGFAADPDLTVIHGIPNLPAAVDVYADGSYLFSFDFEDSQTLTLPADTYFIEVKLQGTTVLSANAELAEDGNYSAIAHLTPDPNGGAAGIDLSLFENNVSPLDMDKVRLTVRHTADAPAVDLGVARFFAAGRYISLKGLNLANDGKRTQFGEIDINALNVRAVLFAAGTSTSVFDSGLLSLNPSDSYIIYAIGSISDGTFTLFIQSIDL
jgi:hypothetical protein